MKFKNTRKTLAAALSVLTMMPNCYQLESGKTEKAKSSQSIQKKGNASFLSKNTTMTVGERIVKDIVLVLGALGVGGFIASKCGGRKDTASSNNGSSTTTPNHPLSSLPVDEAQVTKTDYGYSIENSIARVVLFYAKDSTGEPSLQMMHEIKQPSIFGSLPGVFTTLFLDEQLKLTSICYRSSDTEVSVPNADLAEFILSIAGVSSAQVSAILNLIKSAAIVPTFNSPLEDVSVKPDNVLHALRAAIEFNFGKFIAASSRRYQQKLEHLRNQAPPYTCDLLDANLDVYKTYEQKVLPQCTYSKGIQNDTVLKGLMSDIFVTNKIGFFSPKDYCELSCALHKLESFNYILKDGTRREKVLKVLRVAKKVESLSLADVNLAIHHRDETILYNYLTAADHAAFIEEIKQKAKQSALPLCQTVLEDAMRKKDEHITAENASQIEAAAFNMFLGHNMLDSSGTASVTYNDISRHITDWSLGITAYGILTTPFNGLHQTLEKATTAKYHNYELYNFECDVEAAKKVITAVHGTVSALSTADSTMKHHLDQLKTELNDLTQDVDALLADVEAYDRLPCSKQNTEDLNTLISRFNGLESNAKTQNIYSLEKQINEKIADGATIDVPLSNNFNALHNAFRGHYETATTETVGKSKGDSNDQTTPNKPTNTGTNDATGTGGENADDPQNQLGTVHGELPLNSDSNANPPPAFPPLPGSASELPEDNQSNDSGILNDINGVPIPTADTMSNGVDEFPISE